MGRPKGAKNKTAAQRAERAIEKQSELDKHMQALGLERTWHTLRDVAPLFGLTFESAKNRILKGNFPVPTFRIGKKIMIDRQVMLAYFEKQKEKGLRELTTAQALHPDETVA